MKLLTSSLCLALALAASQAVAQDVVTLTPGDHNIVARIGGEVFTTYHYAGDYQKPFFYPVTAAGGWDLLAKAGADAERVRALRDIESAADAAVKSLAERSTELAVELAGKIVQSKLTKDDHARLIEEAMAKFPTATPSTN